MTEPFIVILVTEIDGSTVETEAMTVEEARKWMSELTEEEKLYNEYEPVNYQTREKYDLH